MSSIKLKGSSSGEAEITVASDGSSFSLDKKLGIGTTSPTQKLDVDGNIAVSGNLTDQYTTDLTVKTSNFTITSSSLGKIYLLDSSSNTVTAASYFSRFFNKSS